jgi:spore maturation protein CgeB
MRVLYIGSDSGTCRQRRFALERLGHQILVIDPFAPFPRNRYFNSWCARTGALGLSPLVQHHVLTQIAGCSFDLALVDSGELVNATLVHALKRHATKVANYNLDNPFTPRDGARWRLFLAALPVYDLFVTPRRSSAQAAVMAGAQRAMVANSAADEIMHQPRVLSEEELQQFASEVVFAGSWMPERGAFLASLIAAGVPLRIFGERWRKAPEFSMLRDHVTEGSLIDENYSKAIAGTKIAIAMLSKGNRDLHTSRSLEIPALGVLLCAERTADHMSMYREGQEAIFWDDAKTCADQVLSLLRQPDRRAAIATAGHRRVYRNRSFNEPLMQGIVAAAMQSQLGPTGAIIEHPVLAERIRSAASPAALASGSPKRGEQL